MEQVPEGVAAALVVLGAALVGGVSGFGFTLLALTMLSFLIDVKAAVLFLAVHTFAHNTVQLSVLRRHVRFRTVVPLIAGGILGVPLGVFFLKHVDSWLVEKTLGLAVMLVVTQAAWSLTAGKRAGRLKSPETKPGAPFPETTAGTRHKLRFLRGGLFGIGAGSLMGAFLSGCPLAVVYSLGEGGSKYTIKATLQSFFFFSSAYALALYALTGLLTGVLFWTSVALLPWTVLGTVLGMRLFERLSNEAFYRVVLVFLGIIGLSLLAK